MVQKPHKQKMMWKASYTLHLGINFNNTRERTLELFLDFLSFFDLCDFERLLCFLWDFFLSDFLCFRLFRPEPLLSLLQQYTESKQSLYKRYRCWGISGD